MKSLLCLLLVCFCSGSYGLSSRGLVKSEDQLLNALSTRSRIVLGSSISITKELPVLTKSVSLVGHAKSCRDRSCSIDAQSKSRHLKVAGSGGRLFAYNLEFRNGKRPDMDGGSIHVVDGASVILNRVTFTNNNVNLFSIGGALSVTNTSSAKIYNCSFISNSAGFGGAIGVSDDGRADIRLSSFQHNSAIFSGGGAQFLGKGTGILADNVFESNSAASGGAVGAHNSLLSICGATLEKNVGSKNGSDIMSEEESSVTFCRLETKAVTGPSAEDCRPCGSLGPFPGVKGDPHIRGPHGEAYDFHGQPDTDYCLISDEDLHLNMRTMGARRGRATYIEEIGLIYRNQTVVVTAETSETSPMRAHQGKLFVNMIELPAESTMWSFPDELNIGRTRNEVTVEVPGRFRLVFRIIRAMYRVRGPGKNFLNIQVAYLKPTNKVDGIFGRLYKGPAGMAMRFTGAGRFKLVADEERYLVFGILSLMKH